MCFDFVAMQGRIQDFPKGGRGLRPAIRKAWVGGGVCVLYASGTMQKVGEGRGRLLSEEGEVYEREGGAGDVATPPSPPLYPPLPAPWSRFLNQFTDLNIILFINMGTKCKGAEPPPPPPPPPVQSVYVGGGGGGGGL